MLRPPGRPVVRSVPLGCSTILAQFVTDVLDAAEDGKDLATGAAVLGAELAGEAFPVAEAPVDNQSGQARPVNRPSPGRPDRPCFAIVGTGRRRLRLRLVVAGRQQDLAAIG